MEKDLCDRFRARLEARGGGVCVFGFGFGLGETLGVS